MQNIAMILITGKSRSVDPRQLIRSGFNVVCHLPPALCFSFKGHFKSGGSKPKGVFRQNESFSFVCQNVTGGSGDIFAAPHTKFWIIEDGGKSNQWKRCKKKKKPQGASMLLVQRHPSTSKGNGIETERCSRYKGQKNHHCYCHPVSSFFFFPFHFEYSATKRCPLGENSPNECQGL